MATSQSQTITRKSASNLALAFVLLPRPKRNAMSALYAFCREVDAMADEERTPVDQRREQLQAWRLDVQRACQGGQPALAVSRELKPFIERHRLPFELFDELIKGCEMDLDKRRYENDEELDLYCYRVASVVGLLSIEIFGYRNPKCREYAVHLGRALQLTNILRDVRNDAERDRIYLPQSALQEFKVTETEVLRHQFSDRFAQLAAYLAGRARDFYRCARESLPAEDRRSMVAAELMGTVYWRLLCKLEHRHFDVLSGPTMRLGKTQKLSLIIISWLRFLFGANTSAYGPA